MAGMLLIGVQAHLHLYDASGFNGLRAAHPHPPQCHEPLNRPDPRILTSTGSLLPKAGCIPECLGFLHSREKDCIPVHGNLEMQ